VLLKDVLNNSNNLTETKLLLAKVLEIPFNKVLLLNLNTKIPKSYNILLKKRELGIPIQYILHSTQFIDINLIINKGMFIPRFETELLADKAVKIIDAAMQNSLYKNNFIVLDLCTGSGAIACYIASKFPDIKVVAVDTSAKGKINTKNYKNIKFVKCDINKKNKLAQKLKKLNAQKADLITMNPPYIPINEVLPLEVKNFDPKIALFGGKKGTEIPIKFAKIASIFLKKNSVLLMEHGLGQETEIIDNLQNFYNKIGNYPDFNKINRILLLNNCGNCLST
jgi:release factor glutamine methyltransferase